MIMLDSELSVRFLGIFNSQEFIEVIRIDTNNHLSAVKCAKWAHDYMTTSTDMGNREYVVFIAMPRANGYSLGVQLLNRHELCIIECTKEERKNILRGHQAVMVILTKPGSTT